MKKVLSFVIVYFSVFALFFGIFINVSTAIDRSEVLKVGKEIPNAQLNRFSLPNVQIEDLKGKIIKTHAKSNKMPSSSKKRVYSRSF